ncbi:P-loop containing nucleoside triphosphatehydrolases superfamily protein [Striga asiatica]|uniref:P-loop containing nucleoside triphosphatehydrolases superfamily protein n=1 Tax=Striga asiatica TaxID=4170 RepID=A0A5A7QC01_STRAF|nr:P-loop containing nucleoside triphosphatehydrolases superfamily protein [Striga asiatica]
MSVSKIFPLSSASNPENSNPLCIEKNQQVLDAFSPSQMTWQSRGVNKRVQQNFKSKFQIEIRFLISNSTFNSQVSTIMSLNADKMIPRMEPSDEYIWQATVKPQMPISNLRLLMDLQTKVILKKEQKGNT